MHRRDKRKNQEAEERSSRKIRWRKCAWEQDSSRLPSLPTVCQEAWGLTIVWGRVPGVGLEWWGAVSRCSGETLYHHCGLARIGNSEVFFVSLSLLSLCFVIIIKYSRAQKGTQALYPHHHSLFVALELNGYFWVTEFLVFPSVLLYFIKPTQTLPQWEFEPQWTWTFAYARS